jgi:hypothetical protein
LYFQFHAAILKEKRVCSTKPQNPFGLFDSVRIDKIGKILIHSIIVPVKVIEVGIFCLDTFLVTARSGITHGYALRTGQTRTSRIDTGIATTPFRRASTINFVHLEFP